MKRHVFFAALLLCAAFAFSQDISLESVCSDLSKNGITKGDFLQSKTIAKTGKKLSSNGKFIFSTEGILWNTLKPFTSTLVLGADYMVQIGSDGNKKVVDARGNDAFKSVSSTLLAVFSNDVSRLGQNFTLVFETSGKDTWIVSLEPKDKTVASVMSSIVLKGKTESGNSEITDIVLNEAKGGSVFYAFTNQSHPKELSEDEKSYFNNR